jgi:protein AATF/BFR2
MKDKDRLIKRTQLDRTSHQDDAYHPETFNDDDFYHNLLKEMISRDECSKWVELQRTRYKNKRKADTRATKGRKIKKDLVPKLVNFMAPMRPMNKRDIEVIPEQIRTELLKSLFGGSVLSRSNAGRDE